MASPNPAPYAGALMSPLNAPWVTIPVMETNNLLSGDEEGVYNCPARR